MKKNRMVSILIGLAVLSIAVWLFLPVISGKTVNTSSGIHEEHSLESEDEHAHSSEIPRTVEELFLVQCEHDVAQSQCDECRYELGLVKVSHELLKENGGPIITEKSVLKKLTDSFAVSGEIQLNENKKVNISPRIPGVVNSVKVDLGAKVKKGDILFEIESQELGQIIGDYRKNYKLTELSRRNYERKKSLFDQKITSEAELIDTQMSYEQSKTELDAAVSKLLAIGLNANEISAIVSSDKSFSGGRLPFRAPISGVVAERQITTGEMVEPGSNVMVLADLSDVWVWLNIYEQDIEKLTSAYGMGEIPVEITSGAFPNEVFYGKIDHLNSVLNETVRALKVRVSLNNSKSLLRPGMFCNARIFTGETDDVMTVPRNAVLNDESETFVFKHLKDDFYLRVNVKTGKKDVNSIEITGGLDAGEEIVTAGAFMLKSDVLREKMGAGCAD